MSFYVAGVEGVPIPSSAEKIVAVPLCRGTTQTKKHPSSTVWLILTAVPVMVFLQECLKYIQKVLTSSHT